MRIIKIENYANQIATITPASDIVVVDNSTGKQYNYVLGSWKEYFQVSAGGNVSVTPLLAGVPSASISDIKTIDSPFVQEVVNNYALINTTVTQAITTTYGWGFIQQHSCKIVQAKMICTIAGGTAQLGLYNSTGTLIAKSAAITCTTGMMTLPLTLDASGSAISSISLTGGNIYYWAISVSVATIAFAGYTGLSSGSFTLNPLQVTAATAIPNTVTLNSGARTTSAWVMLVGGI